MRRFLVAAFVLSLAAFAVTRNAASGRTSFEDLLTRPRPAADATIRYGAGPEQFGELYLPKGEGAHPVVILIHGGCWQAELPGVELMALVAGDLRRRGFVVWNVEYRRLGHPGGGYPGTFLDIGNAVDTLRTIASRYRLDLGHVVAVGHSAGGHLALWAAARAHLPKTSVLRARDPLPLRGVVSLAGIDDLEAYRSGGVFACGGPDTIDALTGNRSRPNAYSDTSPAALLPIGVHQSVISGGGDEIVPARFGHDYAAKARAAGDAVQDVEIPGAGHFELIDPSSPSWPQIAAAIIAVSR